MIRIILSIILLSSAIFADESCEKHYPLKKKFVIDFVKVPYEVTIETPIKTAYWVTIKKPVNITSTCLKRVKQKIKKKPWKILWAWADVQYQCTKTIYQEIKEKRFKDEIKRELSTQYKEELQKIKTLARPVGYSLCVAKKSGQSIGRGVKKLGNAFAYGNKKLEESGSYKILEKMLEAPFKWSSNGLCWLANQIEEETKCNINLSGGVDSDGNIYAGNRHDPEYQKWHNQTFNLAEQFKNEFNLYFEDLKKLRLRLEENTLDHDLIQNDEQKEIILDLAWFSFYSSLALSKKAGLGDVKALTLFEANFYLYAGIKALLSDGKISSNTPKALIPILEHITEGREINVENATRVLAELLIQNSNRSPAYFESAIDLASLGMGIDSISKWNNNTLLYEKVLDVLGVGADTVAAILPAIPGGASGLVKVVKHSGFIKSAASSAAKLGLKAKSEIADFAKFSSRILDNTGSIGNLSKSEVWTKGPKFNGVENAFSHWKKHGKTFPELNNAKEYVEKAKSFFTNPPSGTISKMRPNGEQLLYNPKTNIFGVKTKNGLPKTMFRPKSGQGYWDRLIKKEGL